MATNLIQICAYLGSIF